MRPGVRTVTIFGVGPRLPLLIMYMGTDQQLAFRPPWGTNQISDYARRQRMIKEPISPNNCIKSWQTLSSGYRGGDISEFALPEGAHLCTWSHGLAT